ncbi:MAG: gluconate 2-dehydrogenase gamma chain [Chloroflexota bacterium]|jgi:hypothetical protein|nr:gluconate 2-dehydrogenase gamma chain [Chloroflexota bacterium]
MDIGRRSFIKAAGAVGLLGLLPPGRVLDLLAAPPGPGQAGQFLSADQLDTLRALCWRLVPGPLDGPGLLNPPPGSPDPGAREALCAEAIDILLGAFNFDPPMVHAGGPFSDRHGPTHNDFADFVALDKHAELGWRIRLEGSLGLPEREFAGPVEGLQETYQAGLAHLDATAQSRFGADFKDLSSVQQDLLLTDQSDQQLQGFVGTALSNVFDAIYGPPEYGGNQGLAGWGYTNWDGDVQPQGYTDDQVSTLGASPVPPLHPAAALAAIKLAPGLAGRAASNSSPWAARRPFKRG